MDTYQKDRNSNTDFMTSFTPRHTIIGKGITYVKLLDQNLPLKPIEIELENNRCCMEVRNTSDSTVEFLHGQKWHILTLGQRV